MSKMELSKDKPDTIRRCNAAEAGSKPGKCRGQQNKCIKFSLQYHAMRGILKTNKEDIMAKQFNNKSELDHWISEMFPLKTGDSFFEMPIEPDMAQVAAALAEEGYDLDDLTKNGEAYDIDGHTNNGWIYASESDLSWLKSVGTDMSKVRVRK